jgi:hypothetical protein
MPEEQTSAGFKVVDRRPFSQDGTRRPDVPTEPDKEEQGRSGARAASSTSTSPPTAAPSLEPLADEEEASGEFESLVSFLGTNAMYQLGQLPGPSGERLPADLAGARQMISLLEVLQRKTKGNLTRAEAKLLEDVLYELRLAFVEVQKRGTSKGR